MARVNIALTIDTTDLLAKLKPRAIAYGTQNGLNRTGDDVQTAIRQHLDAGEFHIRTSNTRQFLQRHVAYRDRTRGFASARRGQAWLEIEVQPADRLLLPGFEDGAPRVGFKGKSAALPVIGSPARRAIGATVPRTLYIEKLNFKRAPNGVWYGERGTYEIPGVGVFQRVRGDRSGGHKPGVLLFAFRRDTRLPADLEFEATARKVALLVFPMYMEDAITKEIARGGLA